LRYRAAFDLGETSIGWALFKLSEEGGALRPVALIDAGVRLFENGRDPQKGEALGALRREPRAARRRRDRILQRRRYLHNLLEASGLMPPAGDRAARDAFFSSDPYQLRKRGLSEALTAHEFGRIILHLNQRRGFKSNRKANADENENGKIAQGAAALLTRLEAEGFDTVGAFYADRQSAPRVRDRKAVRIRLNGKGANAAYEFYPQRAMVENEFDRLWDTQARHRPTLLTEALKAELRHALFYQRPLKDPPVGRCTFFPEERRLARGRLLAQEFIIYQKLNNLRYGDEEKQLTLSERDALAAILLSGKKLGWDNVRKKLKLASEAILNLEEGGEKELAPNPIPARFEGTAKKPGPFHGAWAKVPRETQDLVIEKVLSVDDPDALVAWGADALGLSAENAERLARVVLPDGHIAVSEKAALIIVSELKREVVTYDEACRRAGLQHSSFEDGEFFDRLPPYNRISSMQRHLGFGTGDPNDPPDKRFGRIANPTVHIALNQLRRVLNDIADRYGKPDEIVIEVARELRKSKREKDEDKKRRDQNEAANKARRVELANAGLHREGDRRVGEKLLRMRLWEELGPSPRLCPYTGEPISLSMLLSDAVEIEHILPYSRTLDDSPANLTVALLRANRLKRNLAPDEAAARFPDIFDKGGMRARTRAMPANKRWRFEDGAMEKFEAQKSFEDRQLRSTQYLSRIAREYVSKLYPATDASGAARNHVWVVTGALTGQLRRKWGLNLGDRNRKNRDDHRHHAIDACVIGVTDRSLVQRISAIAAREEREGVDRLLADLEEPYAGYRDEVIAAMERLKHRISHRARHGAIDPDNPAQTAGKLHEDTNYGLVRKLPENAAALELGNVVRRKLVEDLKPGDIAKVRDDALRTQLTEVANSAGDDEKAVAAALAAWSAQTGVRRVRVLKQEGAIVPIKSRKTGEPYRYVTPAENVWVDIIEDGDGVWRGVFVDIFAAHSGAAKDWRIIYPDGKFIMRLRKGDTVQLFDGQGKNEVKKVFRLGEKANLLYLAATHEGGELQKRHDDKDDPFRWDFANIAKLKERRARRVRFTATGRMKTIAHGVV
jgi:CRISPR-associated endonuclease Csn1